MSDKSVPNAKELLRKELHTIDWTKVDEYPTVNSCDSIKEKEENKLCFFNSVSDELKTKLKQDSLIQEIKGLREMNVLVTVSKDSEIFFQAHPGDSVRYNVKYINSILKTKGDSFSKIHPALKRGLPVTTKFILPIIL